MQSETQTNKREADSIKHSFADSAVTKASFTLDKQEGQPREARPKILSMQTVSYSAQSPLMKPTQKQIIRNQM